MSHQVSILVILDVALRHIPARNQQPGSKVSILVILDVALRLNVSHRSMAVWQVSILVILDVALRRWGKTRTGVEYVMFQSLLSWMLL